MYKVLLRKPASLRIGTYLFKRGAARIDVPDDFVEKNLIDNPRFRVTEYNEGDPLTTEDDFDERGDITKTELKNPRRVQVPKEGPRQAKPEAIAADSLQQTGKTAKAKTVKAEANKSVEEQQAEGARPEDKTKRLQAIAEAAELLEEGNPKHFTTSGKADARALSSILGWSVTAAERDEAIPSTAGDGSEGGEDAASSEADEGEASEDEEGADESAAEGNEGEGEEGASEETSEPETAAEPAGKVKIKLKPKDDGKADPSKGGAVEV